VKDSTLITELCVPTICTYASVTSLNAFATHGLNYGQFSGAIIMCPSQDTHHRS